MAQVAWMPVGSAGLVGAILAWDQGEPMTEKEYLVALSMKVDALVRRETPERAMEILAQPLWDNDRIDLSTVDLPTTSVGTLLLESGDWLRDKSGLGDENWPVPLSKIKANPSLMRAMKEQTLEEFVSQLYHDPDWM